MDGKAVKSCTMLAAMAEGHEVRTVEGLEVDGGLDPIQEGFHEKHALHCGFCTPGMMMASRALLDENPRTRPTIRDPHRDLRRHLPVHRLREHRRRGPLGRRARSRRSSRRREHGHDRPREPPQRQPGAADRLRPAQAQGGRAVHPRQGQLPGRHHAAGDAARRDPAQSVRAREDQLDRHLRGARAPGRRRGRDRQGPGDARAGVDADDLLRHPGGAGRRQGPLPGPGGGVRDRHRRVHRARRAAADRGRLRAAAGRSSTPARRWTPTRR